MNKYLSLSLFAAFLLGSGFVYSKFYRPAEVGGVPSTGRVVEVNMRVPQDQWAWDPETIRVNAGDKVRLHIYNEDTYDHGFAIDIFGVNRRLFPRRTTSLEFNASLAGKFRFYCSVPCGEGHYDQIGTIIVGRTEELTGKLDEVLGYLFSNWPGVPLSANLHVDSRAGRIAPAYRQAGIGRGSASWICEESA